MKIGNHNMAKLTYDDFKQRLSIQDVLVDAGYTLNRRDGLRYPSYVRLGSDGRRIHGDKFIVTANGQCSSTLFATDSSIILLKTGKQRL